MKLTHYFNQKTANSKPRSRYNLTAEGQTILDTGSSVQVLRLLRKLGAEVPKEMHGSQTGEYKVEIRKESPLSAISFLTKQCVEMTEQRNLLLEACKGLLDGPGDGFGNNSKAEIECARAAINRACGIFAS